MEVRLIVAAILAFTLGVAWDEMPHPLLGWALFAALVTLVWMAFHQGEDK